MDVSFEKILEELQRVSAIAQETIGEAIEKSFGYATTPQTNAFLMYTILVILLFAVVRIVRAPGGKKKASGASKFSQGYDFGRYG